ncbi:uncharacterized protein LOC120341928 [Styela clava]
MGNETAADITDEYQDIRKFALFAGVAAVIVLYIQLLQNRKYWINMEVCLGVMYALSFPFSGVLSPYFMRESDALTVYMCRLLIISFVAQASAVYLTQESSDRTVPVAVSITNILGRGPLLMTYFVAIYTDTFNVNHEISAYIDTAQTALLLFGDIYFMAKTKTRQYRSRTVGDPISFHLSIDALLTFFIGSLALGFPDMFCSLVSRGFQLRECHFFTLRGVAVLILSGSMLSFASLCYRDDKDAVNTLKIKLVVYLPALLNALTNMLIDSHFRTYGHAAIMVGVMGGLAINAGSVVYRHGKED